MLAVEDQLDALEWAEESGGLPALINRSNDNLNVISTWVSKTDWVEFLAEDPATISNTSICLKITDPWFVEQDENKQRDTIRKLALILEDESVAFDISGYRDAPPGIRIWGGATVEASDLQALTLWLSWVWTQLK